MMSPTHVITNKLEARVIDITDPKIEILRTDTGVKLILSEQDWATFFKFSDEIQDFFDGNHRDFHIWLPIDKHLKLECFKNKNIERVMDLRTYERGSETQYFMFFSTSHGFTLKKHQWEILLALKPILDRELILKNAARKHMKDLILQHLTTILFDITQKCQNTGCGKSIAHTQDCSEVNSNWVDRLEATLKEALPELNRSQVIENFRHSYGFEEDENLLFNYCVSNIMDLKNALLFGF